MELDPGIYTGPCDKCIERLEKISHKTDDLITHQNISRFVLQIMMYGRQTDNYDALNESLFVSRPLGYNIIFNRCLSWSDSYAEGIIMPDEDLLERSNFFRVKLRKEKTIYLESLWMIDSFDKKYTYKTRDNIKMINWDSILSDGYGAVGTNGSINMLTDMTLEEKNKYNWFSIFSVSGYFILDPRAIEEFNILIEDEKHIAP